MEAKPQRDVDEIKNIQLNNYGMGSLLILILSGGKYIE